MPFENEAQREGQMQRRRTVLPNIFSILVDQYKAHCVAHNERPTRAGFTVWMQQRQEQQ